MFRWRIKEKDLGAIFDLIDPDDMEDLERLVTKTILVILKAVMFFAIIMLILLGGVSLQLALPPGIILGEDKANKTSVSSIPLQRHTTAKARFSDLGIKGEQIGRSFFR
ncbi:MAG: hypothetical protein HPY75_12645 [Actinobacteria bacterium]|nr:hypothetical protein [Actinomycetota bacterium]